MEFKSSPVGKIPAHWDVRCFKDFVFFQEGPGLRRWQFTETGMKVLNVTNIKGDGIIDMSITDRYISLDEFNKTYKHFAIDNGDIIIASSGNTIGKIGRIFDNQLPAIVNTSTIRFNNSLNPEQLNQEFLYVYLKSNFFYQQLISYATGSAQPNVGPTHVAKMYLPVPPIEEQNIIGKYINDIDKKIHLNTQTNQTLESIAQAIFKSWFVDFEPAKAKMAVLESGGTREQAELAAMGVISGKGEAELAQLQQQNPEHYQQLTETAALFPSAMVESELGEIPEGWEVKTLSEMINIIGGGTPNRSIEDYWNGDIPWFSIKDLPNPSDVFVIDTDEKITELGLKKSSTKLLPANTTIITARGTVGKLALIDKPMCMNQSCYGITGANGIEPIFNYFNLKEAISTLQRNTHGAVFDTITTKTFESYSSAFCGNSLARIFDQTTRPLLEKIKCNLYQIKYLSEIRDSLLPKLLSGEIDLTNLQGEVA